MLPYRLLLSLLATLTIPVFAISSAPPETVLSLTFQIIHEFPHDNKAFTQGLVFAQGHLYEGTGLRGGRSSLRRVDLQTGKVLQQHQLAPQFFGEGVTIFQDKIFQLTYTSHLAFVYDKESFAVLQEFHYPTEGWGLTHDGQQLIMSDGTATLYFRDPETFAVTKELQVFDEAGPVTRLNELEYIEGKIYANIWTQDRIVIIAPQSGQVLNWVDLHGLLRDEDRTQRVNVLNGIAYDAAHKRLFVTGKLWPKLFEIALVPQNQSPVP